MLPLKAILLTKYKSVKFLLNYFVGLANDIDSYVKDHEDMDAEEKKVNLITATGLRSFVDCVQHNMRPPQHEKDVCLALCSSMTKEAAGGEDTDAYKLVMSKIGEAYAVL